MWHIAKQLQIFKFDFFKGKNAIIVVTGTNTEYRH